MKDPEILFLNQVAGPLFRELAEDIATEFRSGILLSGHMDDVARNMSPCLQVVPGPDYNRKNLATRGWSWLRFFLRAMRMVFCQPANHLLFIVSNPPFLPLVGWIASVLRRQRYIILVYDLYPDILIRLGRISPKGPVAIVWRAFNRLVWSRAESVFTIGDYMAENIRSTVANRSEVRVSVVPLWVDVDFIKPLPKSKNPFLASLGWQDRKIILYSGNLGNTHNLDGLLTAAQELKERHDIGFLIIGSGALWNKLEKTISSSDLTNVRLLPFQPEAMLPQTLPAGDISIVSMEGSIAGFMFPSKTLYYMAAGSAILALVPAHCEVADILDTGECGIRLGPGETGLIAQTITRLLDDPLRLEGYQRNARLLAEKFYSRANTNRYIDELRRLHRSTA